MKHMVKRIGIIGLCLVAAFQVVRADTTTVSFDSGNLIIFDNPALHGGSDVALSGGTTNDGNGTVLQLGYFDGATTANNFAGNWVPLSGETSLNTALIAGSSPSEAYNKTSIGDLNGSGAGNGTFALSLDFVTGNAQSGNSLPPNTNIPLAIRFYNGTTIASSTFYNIVSDDTWKWQNPATPPANVTISLNDANLEWLSIALGQNTNTTFHTTIATTIPEPSSLVLLALGLVSVPLARRRLKR
jgi:hypothetical protein